MDAITLLKDDHKTVEKLFRRFEKAGDDAHVEKREVVDRIIEELSKHAVIEEQLFYPVTRATVPAVEDVALESLEEHHVVKWVLSELEDMDPAAERFDAKVTVLMENVRHHVEEEEGEFFPKVRDELGRKALGELGDAMEQARRSAPTRPHPRAPDTPPGNVVAGAASAVADRGLDAARDLAGGALDTARGIAGGSVDAARDIAGGAGNVAKDLIGRFMGDDGPTGAPARARDTAKRARSSAKKAQSSAKKTSRRSSSAAKKAGSRATKAASRSPRKATSSAKKSSPAKRSSATKKSSAAKRASTARKSTSAKKAGSTAKKAAKRATKATKTTARKASAGARRATR